MNKTLIYIFRGLLFFVLGGKVLNAIFNFGTEVKDTLNMLMFVLIGIAFLAACYFWDRGIPKLILGACGAYLLLMNLLPDNTTVTLIGIVCIVVPMLIFGFFKEKELSGEQSHS